MDQARQQYLGAGYESQLLLETTTQLVFFEYRSKSAQRNKSPKHRTREGVVKDLT